MRFKEKMSDKGLHLFELQFEYFTVELLNAYYNIKIEERKREKEREKKREKERERERETERERVGESF